MNSRTNITGSWESDFLKRGHSDPITLMTPEEMARIRPEIEALLSRDPAGDFHSTRGDPRGRLLSNRHLDCHELLSLAAHPVLLDRMAAILGPDLLIWRVQLFNKKPGGREIPWHQDSNFWPLKPMIAASAWIAIDAATVANSCVQLISGSHRSTYHHVWSTPGMEFPKMVDTRNVDLANKIDMELQPGQCFIFSERILHRSEPNRSNNRRLGASVRFIPTAVMVQSYDGADHGTVLVSGTDREMLNRSATIRN